ncbi:type II toxin-antitoxin system VapB family antitoxin [Serinicoccus marinus]|uniref:type II toxin-antitoxin system VapB family antitoxin n=1 Tax=Serinicoccus marinus TaxID=247333 RepID=UPI0003B5100D|nr:type II toxin-antitoxin system VapB family antitoxin [Serinicoccus marinus]
MSLNIKSERVHALAREAARVTGRSQTGAVEEALTRLLRDYEIDPDRAGLEPRMERVRAVVDAYTAADAQLGPEVEITTTDDLYDDRTGLPR